MKRVHQVIALAALSVLASAASAKVIGSGSYSNNFSYTTSGTYVPVISNGGTTLTVNAAKAAIYVATFSAECSVDAPAGNNFAWVDIDLEVNGAVVAPTVGTSDAFCSADGVAGFGGYNRPSITVPIRLNAGANTVRVLGKFQAGATGGWISDSSLVVHQ
jgi:hypothetical protein